MRVFASFVFCQFMFLFSPLALSQQWLTKGTCSLSSAGTCKTACDAAKRADIHPNDTGIWRDNWGCAQTGAGHWFVHTSGDMWQYLYVSNVPPVGPSPPPPSSCSVSSQGASPLDSYQGNPIRVASGEKYEAEIDYRGVGTMPLQVRRSYHSRELGWHFSVASKLEFISDGQYEYIQWINDQGFTVSFANIDGAWVSKSNPSIRLWRQGDQHWRLRDDRQYVHIFSDDGLLQVSSNANVDTQEFLYDLADRLIRVDSNSGDFLTFEYDVSNSLTKIVNAGNETFEYVYSQGQLIEVKYPGGSSKLYHYENSDFPSTLTGITDENGVRYVTWEYDENGRAVSSEHVGGVDRTEFAFNLDGSTTVTNPLQKLTTYHYALVNNEKKLTHIEGHVSQNCEASNAYNSYYVDGTLQTRSDRNGNATLYERDSLGREIRKTSGLNWSGSPQYGYNADATLLVSTPVTKVEEYCWHPAFPQVVKTIRQGSITKVSLNQQGLVVSSATEPRTQINGNCDDVPAKETVIDDLPDDWEWIHFGSFNQGNDGDFDSDGISNFQELYYGLDPTGGPDDSDQDGMLDGWEFEYFGDLRQEGNGDYDGDGETNYQEHVAGRNPTANDNFNYLDQSNSNNKLIFSEFNTTISGGQTNQWFASFGKYALGAEQKHYWEVEVLSEHTLVGIGSDLPLTSYPGSNNQSYGWWSNQGALYHNNQSSAFLDYGPGDILMLAYDSAAGKLWLGKNGEWQGDPSTGTNPTFSNITGTQYPIISLSGTNASATVMFNPAQFNYPIPENYLRLDSDLDGLYDDWELQHFGNLSQSSEGDFDSDGITNGVELEFGLDPTDGNADSDSDTLSDAWELQYFNTLDRDGSDDFDGDGIIDADEFVAGTDPLLNDRRNYLDPNNTLTGLVLSIQNRVVAAQYSKDRWRSSIAKSALGAGQKYYWEVGGSGNRVIAGIASNIELVQHFYAGSTSNSYGSGNLDGNIFNNGSNVGASVGGYENGRLMVAYDPEAGKLWFGRDGIWQGDPVAGADAHFSNLSGLMYPVVSIYSAGQASIYFQSSEFLYSPPEGFEASLLYDVDEDGLSDSWEFDYFGNLSQLAENDFDGDGLSNQQEFDMGLDPLDGNPDSDTDGILDSWEATYFGSLNRDGTEDFDGDSFSDLDEFNGGTDPTVNQSRNHLDPEKTVAGLILSQQNRAVKGETNNNTWRSSIAKSPLFSGQKYYWEVSGSGNRIITGIGSNFDLVQGFFTGSTATSYGSVNLDGNVFKNSYNMGTIGGYENGRLMVAFDPDEGKLWFGRNGVWQGDPANGTGAFFENVTGTNYPIVSVIGAGEGIIHFQANELQYSPPQGFVVSEVE